MILQYCINAACCLQDRRWIWWEKLGVLDGNEHVLNSFHDT